MHVGLVLFSYQPSFCPPNHTGMSLVATPISAIRTAASSLDEVKWTCVEKPASSHSQNVPCKFTHLLLKALVCPLLHNFPNELDKHRGASHEHLGYRLNVVLVCTICVCLIRPGNQKAGRRLCTISMMVCIFGGFIQMHHIRNRCLRPMHQSHTLSMSRTAYENCEKAKSLKSTR